MEASSNPWQLSISRFSTLSLWISVRTNLSRASCSSASTGRSSVPGGSPNELDSAIRETASRDRIRSNITEHEPSIPLDPGCSSSETVAASAVHSVRFGRGSLHRRTWFGDGRVPPSGASGRRLSRESWAAEKFQEGANCSPLFGSWRVVIITE